LLDRYESPIIMLMMGELTAVLQASSSSTREQWQPNGEQGPEEPGATECLWS